jgi:hypothetical protein
VGRNVATLRFRQASFLEEDRYNVITGDVKRYFDCVKDYLRTIPSVFVWNVDETRIGSPKKRQVPIVIISARTAAGLVTVPESRGDSQLRLLTTISPVGDSM